MKYFKLIFSAAVVCAVIFFSLGIAQQFTFAGRLDNCVATVTPLYGPTESIPDFERSRDLARAYCLKNVSP